MGQVIVNKNTSQTPLTNPVGAATGLQSDFFIPAARFYTKDAEADTPAPIDVKSDGATPAGYDDMGMMLGATTVSYNKNVVRLTSGIDKKLRRIYNDEITGSFEVFLGQFDDYVLQKVTGLTPYQVQSGSIVRFAIGSETLVQKAVLLVVQNKVDGKEIQYYNPAAYLTFSIEEQDGAQVVKVTCDLPLFTWNAVEQLFAMTVFHQDL